MPHQSFDFTANLAAVIFHVKKRDAVNAAGPVKERIPGGGHIIAQGADQSQTGHYNTTHNGLILMF